MLQGVIFMKTVAMRVEDATLQYLTSSQLSDSEMSEMLNDKKLKL